jgi:hypothetical protein
MDFKWVNGNETLTDSDHYHKHVLDCNCCLLATIKDPKCAEETFRINRYSGNQRRETQDMIKEMFARLSNMYHFVRDEAKKGFRTECAAQVCQWEVSNSSYQNQTTIPKMLPQATLPRESFLPPVPIPVYEFYRLWDLYYFSTVLNIDLGRQYFVTNVWKSTPYAEGLPWDVLRKCKVTLRDTMLIKLSWYNRCFGGDEEGRYIGASQTGIFQKIPSLLQKNDQPTRDLSPEGAKVMSASAIDAIDYMDQYMETDRYHGLFPWEWSRSMPYQLAPRGGTASGLRYCPDKTIIKEGDVHRHYGGVGKKIEQFPYAAREVSDTCEKFFNGDSAEIDHPDNQSYMVPKDEKQCVYNPFGEQKKEQQKDVNTKMRFFFLLSYIVTIFGTLVGKVRQIVERGKMIKIGMVWWFGGAASLAEQLRWDDPDMIWEDGDFRGLDKTLCRALLVLYLAGHKRYHSFAKTASGYQSEKLYDAIIKYLSKRMPVKYVNIFSDLWTVMYGCMPSGAFETSHGDSWIVGFLFFLYCVHQMKKFPKFRRLFEKELKAGRIHFIVYGDDHVLAYPKYLGEYISEAGFAGFVSQFFSMEIRNIRKVFSFTSVLKRDGEVCGQGVVFLQKYFIRNTTGRKDLPEILPVRPLSKTILKCAYGSKGEKWTIKDYLLGTVGMAYDSGGTNPLAYTFCHQMFSFLLPYVEKEEEIKVFKMKNKDSSINRVIRKAGISEDELKQGFPTLDRLYDMHIRDDSKNGTYSAQKVYDVNLMFSQDTSDPFA